MPVNFDSSNLELDELDIFAYTDDTNTDTAINISSSDSLFDFLGISTTFVAVPASNSLELAENIFYSGVNFKPLADSNHFVYVNVSSDDTLPAPLLPNTIYEAHYVGMSSFPGPALFQKLTDPTTHAIIDITDAGVGTHTITIISIPYLYRFEGLTFDVKDQITKPVGSLHISLSEDDIFWTDQFQNLFLDLFQTLVYTKLVTNVTAADLSFNFSLDKIKNVFGFEFDNPTYPFRDNDAVVITGAGLPENFTPGQTVYLDMLNGDKFLLLDGIDGTVVTVTNFVIGDYPLFHIEEIVTRALRVTSHGLQTGEVVRATTSGSLLSPLMIDTDYYVFKLDDDLFYLSNSPSLVPANFIYLDSTTGSGTHTLTVQLQEEEKAMPVGARWISSNRRGIKMGGRS